MRFVVKQLCGRVWSLTRCGLVEQGPDTSLLKELRKARSSAAKIDPDKAERGVRKVLKNFAELQREIEEVEALALKEESNPSEEEDDDDTADD
jgi:hypothetical protein